MYQLYHGDCLELMNEIPDNSVDMILCDLPYGITKNEWDAKIPLDALWAQYKRIRKDATPIVLFAQMPFTAELVMSNKREFKYIWTWYKHCTRGFLNAKKQPLRTTEHIAVFYKRQCTYDPKMRKGAMRDKGGSSHSTNYGKYFNTKARNDVYYPTDILDFPAVTGTQKNKMLHPTQKPVKLLEYLIETYSTRGGHCVG